MKYLILILFFSVSAFSHESKEKHGEARHQHLRKTLSEKDLRANLTTEKYFEILGKTVTELSKKDNIEAQLLMTIFRTDPKKYKYEGGDWDRLTHLRSEFYWRLKALDSAFKKGVCLGLTISFIQLPSERAYSRYSKLDFLTKTGQTSWSWFENPNIRTTVSESLKRFIPFYYASAYIEHKMDFYHEKNSSYTKELDEKADSHYFETYDFSMPDFISKIEKLDEKTKKQVWDLVEKWEKRENYKIYTNPRQDRKNCGKNSKKEEAEIHQKMLDLYLED